MRAHHVVNGIYQMPIVISLRPMLGTTLMFGTGSILMLVSLCLTSDCVAIIISRTGFIRCRTFRPIHLGFLMVCGYKYFLAINSKQSFTLSMAGSLMECIM